MLRQIIHLPCGPTPPPCLGVKLAGWLTNQPPKRAAQQPRHGGGDGPQGNWIRRPPQGCSCAGYHAIFCQSLQILQLLSSNHSAGNPRRKNFFALPTQDASKMAQKINFLQTWCCHRVGFALGRVHDGFGAQHGPNWG